MSTNNIGFYEEMKKIIFQLSLNIHFTCSSEERWDLLYHKVPKLLGRKKTLLLST